MRRLLVAILLLLVAAWPAAALAADVPMYDNNPARTRSMTDMGLTPRQIYLSAPVALTFDSNQQSYSTPTVVGNDFYQYSYTTNGVGVLQEWRFPHLTAAGLLAQYDGINLPPQPIPYRGTEVVHNLYVGASEGYYGVAGQDSLATAEGFQAIAVGHRLYSWRQGTWPHQAALGEFGRLHPGRSRQQPLPGGRAAPDHAAGACAGDQG